MRYTETHEWVLKDGATARVGITKRAVKEIGEVVYVHLPKVGVRFERDEEVLVIESTKAAIDSYMPLTGVVTKVNNALNSNLDLINSDPEGEGWLYEIEIEVPTEYQNLSKTPDSNADLSYEK